MGFTGLLVTEIFSSIQGETSLSGYPFTFIRLTGCNLRCTYCDTAYAFKGGTRMSLKEIIAKVSSLGFKNVLITGGEPLLQRQTPVLAKKLQDLEYSVSIETHGEISIQNVATFARIVMDIKTPHSGMCRKGFYENLKWLKPTDEIKFVIASEEDYEWSKKIVNTYSLPTNKILFSPATQAKNQPGKFVGISPKHLAEQIVKDRLPVRMQLQIHKIIWGPDQTGV